MSAKIANPQLESVWQYKTEHDKDAISGDGINSWTSKLSMQNDPAHHYAMISHFFLY